MLYMKAICEIILQMAFAFRSKRSSHFDIMTDDNRTKYTDMNSKYANFTFFLEWYIPCL